MRTFKELLDRVAEVQGVPFAELAGAHGLVWPAERSRRKGLAGDIVEAAMGLPKNQRSEADLTFLGLEIKTVPIGEDLEVLERTKITMVNFEDVIAHGFEESTVARKLRSIIFVPIVKFDLERPEHWYIRSPFIWMPSLLALEQLRNDYEEVRLLVRSGDVDGISSKPPPKGQGVHMVASTAGRDSADTTAYETGGVKVRTKRRAWMFRKEFTTRMIRENIVYKALAQDPRP